MVAAIKRWWIIFCFIIDLFPYSEESVIVHKKTVLNNDENALIGALQVLNYLLSSVNNESAGPCSSNPCQNDGTCKAEGQSFKCECKSLFKGKMCEMGPCSSSPCQNNGTCKVDGLNFKCDCKTPFKGKLCETGPCSSNPCQNNGTCKVNGQSFKCDCKSPFTGNLCETGPCSSKPCQNNGTCKVDGQNFKCDCKLPFKGKLCEMGPCSSNPCQNDGTCKAEGQSFKCECKSPFKGKMCEMGPCSSNPCQNDGTCKVEGHSFKCECKSPFKGKLCETEITSKITSSTTESSIISTLSITRDLTITTSEPRNFTHSDNETASETETCTKEGDCLNGGTCEKLQGNESACNCTLNFTGHRCEVNKCENVDPLCKTMGGICRVQGENAVCECPPDKIYHRKSGICEEICDPQKCSHGTCEVVEQKYQCNCYEGYVGTHCDEKVNKAYTVWFTVIASIAIFMCLLLIGMFCIVCQIRRVIGS